MAKFLKDLDNCSHGEMTQCSNSDYLDFILFSSISLGHSKTFLSDKDINLLLTFPFYVSSFCLGNPTSNFCGWLVCGIQSNTMLRAPPFPNDDIVKSKSWECWYLGTLIRISTYDLMRFFVTEQKWSQSQDHNPNKKRNFSQNVGMWICLSEAILMFSARNTQFELLKEFQIFMNIYCEDFVFVYFKTRWRNVNLPSDYLPLRALIQKPKYLFLVN